MIRHNVDVNSMARLRLPTRSTVAWMLVLVMPLLLLSTYLFVSRQWFAVNTSADYVAFGTAICVGIFGVCMLVRTGAERILAALVYIVVVGSVLIYYAFYFVCGMFGDCL
jgi:hypothetical protein